MATLQELDLDQLVPLKTGQPRQYFNQKALEELAESMKSEGVIEPLVVRLLDSGQYEIICGERRWRAAGLAGLLQVPCVVKEEHEISSAYRMALVENIQREDLTPLEEALGLKEIKEALEQTGQKGTQHEIAKTVKKGRDYVVKTMSILNLSDLGISYFREYPEDLHKGHAYAISGLEQGHEVELIEQILSSKLSVRTVERRAKRYKDAYKNAPPDYSNIDCANVAKLVRLIQDQKGCTAKINVSEKSKKYELILSTCGGESFEGLLESIEVDLSELHD